MSHIIEECSLCHGQGLIREEVNYLTKETKFYIQCSRCGRHGPIARSSGPKLTFGKLYGGLDAAVDGWNAMQNIKRRREKK